jgi:hypothetical protein
MNIFYEVIRFDLGVVRMRPNGRAGLVYVLFHSENEAKEYIRTLSVPPCPDKYREPTLAGPRAWSDDFLKEGAFDGLVTIVPPRGTVTTPPIE